MNKLKGFVKCNECKHLIEEYDAQKVETLYHSEKHFYYCPEHRKKYDIISPAGYEWHSGNDIPAHYFIKLDRLEVDADGVLVDYVRKDKKNK